MCAQSIAELESALENERLTVRRQTLLKQIWKVKRAQEETALEEPSDELTNCLNTLSVQQKENSRVANEPSPVSTAV